jgi:tetratricopeptide (TPR) repeat protein
LLAWTRVAAADDPEVRAAKRHYERGQKLFSLHKFEEALGEFQQAFDAKPIPDFLFNIGQCHRNLGDYDAAVFSFKRFLKLDPEAPNREQVEALIADLEQRQAAATTQKFGFAPRPAAPSPRRAGAPFYKKWWFWTGLAVAGAAGGVGVYAATRPDGPPSTDLGNIGFEK